MLRHFRNKIDKICHARFLLNGLGLSNLLSCEVGLSSWRGGLVLLSTGECHRCLCCSRGAASFPLLPVLVNKCALPAEAVRGGVSVCVEQVAQGSDRDSVSCCCCADWKRGFGCSTVTQARGQLLLSQLGWRSPEAVVKGHWAGPSWASQGSISLQKV